MNSADEFIGLKKKLQQVENELAKLEGQKQNLESQLASLMKEIEDEGIKPEEIDSFITKCETALATLAEKFRGVYDECQKSLSEMAQ